MKFRLPRRKSLPEPEMDNKADEPVAPLEMEQVAIDITVPRECVYQSFRKQPGPCPRCGGALHLSHQVYKIGTFNQGKLADSFITSADIGWFCLACPTVVVNLHELKSMLQVSLPHWNIGSQVAVLGLVNLDAIPQDKANLPLGGNDNPVPLVRFTNPRQLQSLSSPGRRAKSKAHRR